MEQKVPFSGEYITLGQLLKKIDLAQTGGHVKALLDELVITVNGEQENRRGRKLHHGDLVIIDGHGRFRLE